MTFNFNIEKMSPVIEMPKVSNVISAEKASGLCFWIDGQHNTINGPDKSKTYMEDLMISYNGAYNIAGISQNLNNGVGNVWDGDYLKLGNFANYPNNCTNKSKTIEVLFKLNSVNTNWGNICAMANSSGFVLRSVQNTQIIQFLAYEAEQKNYCYYNSPNLELNTPYYVAITIEPQKEVKFRMQQLNYITKSAFRTPLSTSSAKYMGMGCNSSATPSAEYPAWEGLSIGMIRMWNRTLSEDELGNYYLDTKKRFNF